MQPQHKQNELWIENLITAFVSRAVLHCTKCRWTSFSLGFIGTRGTAGGCVERAKFSSVPVGGPKHLLLLMPCWGYLKPDKIKKIWCCFVFIEGPSGSFQADEASPGTTPKHGWWVMVLTWAFFRGLTQRIHLLPGFYYSIKQCAIFSALICFEIIQPYFIMPYGTHQYCLCICLMRAQ